MDVQASAIAAYAFCPRRCYYEYIENVFYHNIYTKHGSLLHQHADKVGSEKRDERELVRSLYLYSERYGLIVRCDIVEERDGEVYPVEYKRGKEGDWDNNLLQLCAQGLALEEHIQTPVNKGYLYFYGSSKRKEVMLTNELRTKTIEVIQHIRDLSEQKIPPQGIQDPHRCPACSLYQYCLPFETEELRGVIQWERYI